jgi:hypothetical protein
LAFDAGGVRGRLCIGFALCVAVASACGSDGAVGSTDATFRSRVYDYSIELPDDWSAIPASTQLANGQAPLTGPPVTDVIARRPDRRVSRMQLPALVIGAQPLDERVNLDDWVTTVIAVADEQKQCGAPKRRSRIEVGTLDAVLLTYPDCPNGSGLDHFWVALVTHGRGFHMVFFDSVGNERADRELLERIVSSVSFDR